jgi:hypothetical protein
MLEEFIKAFMAPESTELQSRYSDAELSKVVEQGLIYMCACPAQVAEALGKLRALHRYQMNCLAVPQNDSRVHGAIARSVALAHATLENCLDEVVALEKWDRATLTMPDFLRARQLHEISSDE